VPKVADFIHYAEMRNELLVLLVGPVEYEGRAWPGSP